MDSVISKFKLYEYFRILLPGSYLTFLIYLSYYHTLNDIFNSFHWSIIALIVIISSLLLGIIVFSLDFARLVKSSYLPTKIMSAEFPSKYPAKKVRENEHIYFSWYEKSQNKSKTKTELFSGLYHLCLNFLFCSIIGLIIGIIFCCKYNYDFILVLNLILFVMSLSSSFLILNCRLRYQWQRNYWEFRYEYIREKPEI